MTGRSVIQNIEWAEGRFLDVYAFWSSSTDKSVTIELSVQPRPEMPPPAAAQLGADAHAAKVKTSPAGVPGLANFDNAVVPEA